MKDNITYQAKCYGGQKMSMTKSKNSWTLFLLLLVGIVVGGFIGSLAGDNSLLYWLNYGQSFGFENPIVLNLGILIITFGLTIKITMASIIGVILAIVIYRLL